MSLQEQISSPSELIVGEYQELMHYAKSVGAELGVPYEIYNPTLRLVEELNEFDARIDTEIALESMQTLPLALAVADEMIAFYNNPMVDKRMVWSATLLHDIGKITMPVELLKHSKEGKKTWTDENFLIMSKHAVNGARIAEANGLPQVICRPIAEHHGKQLSRMCYGEDPKLEYGVRDTRECVAPSDFIHASVTRNNTRNAGKEIEELLDEARADIRLVFNDYDSGTELARRVFNKLSSIVAQSCLYIPEL